ncbi:hypothetical protein ACFQX6_31250 [Streptosporangium lutulentum]
MQALPYGQRLGPFPGELLLLGSGEPGQERRETALQPGDVPLLPRELGFELAEEPPDLVELDVHRLTLPGQLFQPSHSPADDEYVIVDAVKGGHIFCDVRRE